MSLTRLFICALIAIGGHTALAVPSGEPLNLVQMIPRGPVTQKAYDSIRPSLMTEANRYAPERPRFAQSFELKDAEAEHPACINKGLATYVGTFIFRIAGREALPNGALRTFSILICADPFGAKPAETVGRVLPNSSSVIVEEGIVNYVELPDQARHFESSDCDFRAEVQSEQICLPEGYEVFGTSQPEILGRSPNSYVTRVVPHPTLPNCAFLRYVPIGGGYNAFRSCNSSAHITASITLYGRSRTPPPATATVLR